MTFNQCLNKYFIPTSDDLPDRRYDLDWMRVIAFGLLIFFHIGMLYVESWGFHIKSQYLSHSLENVMLIVEPWRMALLWFISGVAIRFILIKVSLQKFIILRSYRLLLPLLFGILVIVPPQLYYEMTFNGDFNGSYWSFYNQFFQLDNPVFKDYQAGIWPHIDVNHLWYLRELWLFSLYLLPLLPFLNSVLVTESLNKIAKLSGFVQLLIFSLPILVIQLTLGTDDEREVLGFTFMVYGYLIGWHQAIWQKIKQSRGKLLLAALVCYGLLLIGYNLILLDEQHNKEPILYYGVLLIYGFARVVWLLAILGIAHASLNHNSAKLKYLTEAVYPYYILHQTVIIICGYELSQMKLGGIVEPIILIGLTLLICSLAFEVIRRVGILRPLFGLKIKATTPDLMIKLGFVVASILVLPIAIEIIL